MLRRTMTAGLALVAALALAGALISTASAQPALPFKAYGSGLRAGQVVTAMNGSTEVARATVDASGNWQMDIPADRATNGTRITFNLDGQPTNQSVTFQSGQFVPPPGLTLTVAPGGGTATTTPGPSKTGNAGLAGASQSGASLALVLGLGALAAAGAVGGRFAVRRR